MIYLYLTDISSNIIQLTWLITIILWSMFWLSRNRDIFGTKSVNSSKRSRNGTKIQSEWCPLLFMFLGWSWCGVSLIDSEDVCRFELSLVNECKTSKTTVKMITVTITRLGRHRLISHTNVYACFIPKSISGIPLLLYAMIYMYVESYYISKIIVDIWDIDVFVCCAYKHPNTITNRQHRCIGLWIRPILTHNVHIFVHEWVRINNMGINRLLTFKGRRSALPIAP